MSDKLKQSETLNAALIAAGVNPAALNQVALAAIAIVLALETTIDEKDETIDTHEGTIAEHEKTIAGNEATIADQDESLTEAGKFNNELQKKLEAISAGGKVVHAFIHKGKAYSALHSVNLDGKKYSPKEIAETADVYKKLVENNSSAVKEQPDEDDD